MAADDWSLTPATLARVAELPTPDVPDPDALGAKALESLDAGARLGIDSCGVCGAPEDAMETPRECTRCKAVVYCCDAHMKEDTLAHAEVCHLLAFDADLADVEVEGADAAAAAAVKSTVSNLKLLGRRTTNTLLGPRGYGDEGDDENEAAVRAARDEATKPRWRAMFKLAKSDDDAKGGAQKNEKENETRAAAVLRRHGELLSAPLSLVAASWLFPVVKYALMLGVGGEGRAEEDADKAALSDLTPAHVHVVCGEGRDWCDAAVNAFWLVGYGAGLEKPGVTVTVIAPDLPEAWHGTRRQVGGDEKGTRFVAFHRGRYDDFAQLCEDKGEDAPPGPCMVLALDLCEAIDEASDGGDEEGKDEEGNEEEPNTREGNNWMTAVRAAGCPVLTANRNKFELAAERERMEEGLGYVLVGMGRSPFPCPVPRQSPASANELHRRNEWLAAYVPSPGMQSDVGDAGAEPGASAKRSAGGETGAEASDGKKRAKR